MPVRLSSEVVTLLRQNSIIADAFRVDSILTARIKCVQHVRALLLNPFSCQCRLPAEQAIPLSFAAIITEVFWKFKGMGIRRTSEEFLSSAVVFSLTEPKAYTRCRGVCRANSALRVYNVHPLMRVDMMRSSVFYCSQRNVGLLVSAL